MSKDNGGPAFPTVVEMAPEPHEGMTLRDYFAAKAMQGFAADPQMDTASAEQVAMLAYDLADAMIEARKK